MIPFSKIREFQFSSSHIKKSLESVRGNLLQFYDIPTSNIASSNDQVSQCNEDNNYHIDRQLFFAD
jgi:hypothetical protein